jgi:hypothetical protein
VIHGINGISGVNGINGVNGISGFRSVGTFEDASYEDGGASRVAGEVLHLRVPDTGHRKQGNGAAGNERGEDPHQARGVTGVDKSDSIVRRNLLLDRPGEGGRRFPDLAPGQDLVARDDAG